MRGVGEAAVDVTELGDELVHAQVTWSSSPTST
jgi:hypothetical protein